MNIGGRIQSGRSGSQTYVTSVSSKDGNKKTQAKTDAAKNLREQIKNLNKTTETKRDPNKPIVFQGHSESVVSRSQKYMESVRMERAQTQKTEQAVKKMKYNFKDVSTKIIRSKTSQSAKQAAGQAKREITRLKRARASGKYDDEEISTAIAHAKAVERVARKKVKHLEQEELATASSRSKEQEERLEETTPRADQQMLDSALEEEVEKAVEEEANLEEVSEEPMEEIAEMMEFEEMPDMTEMMSEFEEFSMEIMEDMVDSYEEMMEDLGMEELNDSLMAASGNMSKEEIQMMKTEHRNKEVRDLIKADMEYLKAVFDHLEKQQAASAAMNTAAPVAAPTMSTGSGVETPQEALARVMPSIDITL